MVTGQLGVIGVHVVSRVDLVYMNVTEIVPIPNLYMVVMIVQEWARNLGIVRWKHYVQV